MQLDGQQFDAMERSLIFVQHHEEIIAEYSDFATAHNEAMQLFQIEIDNAVNSDSTHLFNAKEVVPTRPTRGAVNALCRGIETVTGREWGVDKAGNATWHLSSRTQDMTSHPLELPHPIVQIATGARHTLLRDEIGDVYADGHSTFGSCGAPAEGSEVDGILQLVRIELPGPAIDIAAGEHHSLICLADGRVAGCGSSKQGTVARSTMICYRIAQGICVVVRTIGDRAGWQQIRMDHRLHRCA